MLRSRGDDERERKDGRINDAQQIKLSKKY
jgi:hypothetical protein